jgi:uncharacterized membrane protein
VYSHDEAHTSLWISGHTKDEFLDAVNDREVGIRELQVFQRVNSESGVLKTVAVLAETDPQHPPLYYALVRLWAQMFGDSVWMVRSFSLLAGLLALPCVYWMCRELFGGYHVARLATTLAALSPFHVLYAQEAREYSLWTVTILLSSVALWRASITQAKAAWALYFLTIPLGLYTHTLFVLVMFSHASYMLLHCVREAGADNRLLRICFGGYFAATLTGVIVFVPWLKVMSAHLSQGNFAATTWGSVDVSLSRLVAMWGFNFSTLFYDVDKSWKFAEFVRPGLFLSYGFQVLILVLVGYSLYYLFRRAPWQPRIFLLSLIVVPVVILALPDVLVGGMRSGGGNRYFLPSYLGVGIAVAYLLVSQVDQQRVRRPLIWPLISGALLAAGLVSCIFVSQAETWWIKSTAYYSPRISRIVNNSKRPLLIVGALPPELLSFSHTLDEKVRLLVVSDPQEVRISEGYSEIFLYRPSKLLRQVLAARNHLVETADASGGLYRMVQQPIW